MNETSSSRSSRDSRDSTRMFHRRANSSRVWRDKQSDSPYPSFALVEVVVALVGSTLVAEAAVHSQAGVGHSLEAEAAGNSCSR
jgi:hypothetical protein